MKEKCVKLKHNEWQKLRKSSYCHLFFYHKKARKRDEKGTGGMYMPDASFFPKG